MRIRKGTSHLCYARIAVAFGLLTALSAIPGHAVTTSFMATVERTLVADEDRWGGCMVYTNVTLSDLGLDCRGRWVTFSCSGVHTTKDVAYRMFDSAQMAMALTKPVRLYVSDQKKHNDYCYANRIDVLK